jgi:predicted RND superfamily exporter protein
VSYSNGFLIFFFFYRNSFKTLGVVLVPGITFMVITSIIFRMVNASKLSEWGLPEMQKDSTSINTSGQDNNNKQIIRYLIDLINLYSLSAIF